MSKQSKITNLIVMPLIASAVFLANPVFADNLARPSHKEEVRSMTTKGVPSASTKMSVAGTVVSINGNIILVTSSGNVQYTVDAGAATIMKAGIAPDSNPSLVKIADVKAGDAIVVRGEIKDTEFLDDF